jgi:hypothetical protein
MSKQWTLTVRNGSEVERLRFENAQAAVLALEQRLEELTPQVKRGTVGILKRRFDPVRQVMVRGEIAGPGGLWGGVHGGVDLRGDGSAESYTGRLRRTLVQLAPGENPYEGLLRSLEQSPGQ